VINYSNSKNKLITGLLNAKFRALKCVFNMSLCSSIKSLLKCTKTGLFSKGLGFNFKMSLKHYAL